MHAFASQEAFAVFSYALAIEPLLYCIVNFLVPSKSLKGLRYLLLLLHSIDSLV